MPKPNDGTNNGKALGRNKNDTTEENIDIVAGAADVVGTDGSDFLDYSDDTTGLHIDGGLGNDTILGGSGNDTLEGGRNIDYLDGGGGSDTYLYSGGDHSDYIFDTGTGTNDWDVVVVESNTTLWLNGLGGVEEITSTGNSSVSGYVLDDTLDFSDVELNGIDWIGGYSGNDTIIGNDDANTIYGGSGDDVIVGNGGDDIIHGGTGADQLTGGEGSDTFVYMQANEGGDTITDFTTGVSASGGDVLDLSQIMKDEVTITQDEEDPTDAVVTVTSGSVTTTIILEDVDANTWTDDNWIL